MTIKKRGNSVRIIAGEFRGRRLPVTDLDGLRPTTDRVRETLFNWLMHDVQGSRCLDLFAGSGALGFESLSRGASHVDFVEIELRAAKQIQENISLLNLTERAKVWNETAESFVTKIPSAPYNIVFVDPPFANAESLNVISKLADSALISDRSLVYLETPSKGQMPPMPEHWSIWRQGVAGASQYCLFLTTDA